MKLPQDLKYTKEHEWIKIDGDMATIGITDHAQGELGDIIFVEFPDTDQEIELDEPFGTIEAVKTVADLFGPLTGRVVEINDILEDNPEKVNEDSYGDGWILKISISNPGELNALLSADQYASLIN
ncbi:MAG: glycine cleavage system protein GcvH [Candidatus Marinimicrobia bacterium]|jgi:glycine cleavage system H protein|nr:glycine cleavage system protein GcvH [Candidatus Neomarinimicrobiota bacterium]MBT3947889.1 glycine cleavage system protein GcvH [Candidatus Neomarinimicrobiota bacterium]MBT4064154.1 glycine cleavage system protein GcvH [Candidatus Neomarinimicrobiota bacterium]MBT4453413.1 glycine cleavage system protein GcvH [Candidatus Neomarinimicrobiota bacterium]MBT4736730.1 glycine cleavage system protein GcvH [Candidatus Neomarinimicrobiota bacterium]|tara:strand:+ start:1723 stop:2100 length:378 start_codon:yes stop_codon:yes gene_type:complete